jgi:hypothetical protein
MSVFTRWIIPNSSPDSVKSIIWWWEKRRIIYNLLVGAVGIVSFIAYLYLWDCCVRGPNELDGSPGPACVAVLWGITANVFYTLGWIVESAVRLTTHRGHPNLGPRMFALGLYFSIFLAVLPGAWTAIDAIMKHR